MNETIMACIAGLSEILEAQPTSEHGIPHHVMFMKNRLRELGKQLRQGRDLISIEEFELLGDDARHLPLSAENGFRKLLAEIELSINGRESVSSTPSAQLDPTLETSKGEGSMRDQVFISYSHKDEQFFNELQTHLTPFVRFGSITAWSDKDVQPGAIWFDEIKDALAKTRVAVLLVSPAFLASKFIHKHELTPLLKEAESGNVKILWIPIRASGYEETPLKKYQAFSPLEKPFARMMKAERDSAWVDVCKGIKKALNP